MAGEEGNCNAELNILPEHLNRNGNIIYNIKWKSRRRIVNRRNDTKSRQEPCKYS